MTEKPFVHKSAYANMITNFIFHEDFIKIFKRIMHLKGILNIGGKTSSVYNFVRKHQKVKKKYINKKSKWHTIKFLNEFGKTKILFKVIFFYW